MRHALSTIFALAALVSACDPPNPGGGDLQPEGGTSAPAESPVAPPEAPASQKEGALVVGEVELSQNSVPDSVEGDALTSDVRRWVDDGLGRVEALERSPGGPALEIEWTLRSVEVEGGLHRAYARGRLRLGVDVTDVRIYQTSALRMIDPESKEKITSEVAQTAPALLELVIQDLLAEFGQDHAVRAATDARLTEVMRRGELLRGEAAERALGRVRTPIVAGKIEGGADILRRYLAHDRERLVLGAAGALVEMEDVASGPAFVEAATRLSRDGERTGYTAMLFQLGLLGGDAPEAYLESVCSGHPDEAIRADACAARGGK